MKKMRISILVVILAVVAGPLTLFSFQGPPGCGQDCSTCHSLTVEEASKLLKADVLKLEIVSVGKAPVSGVWEVTGKQGSREVKAYLDYGKKFLLDIKAFVPLADIGKAPELRKVDVKSIPLGDAFIVGNPLAAKKIIVFSDPDCPFCRKLHAEIKELVKKRKDVAFYIKLYPLAMHPEAYDKSKTVVCKKSTEMLDDIFEGKAVPKADCDTKVLDENIKLAQSLGITGTPAMVLPDGRVIPGFVDGETIMKTMESK